MSISFKLRIVLDAKDYSTVTSALVRIACAIESDNLKVKHGLSMEVGEEEIPSLLIQEYGKDEAQS